MRSIMPENVNFYSPLEQNFEILDKWTRKIGTQPISDKRNMTLRYSASDNSDGSIVDVIFMDCILKKRNESHFLTNFKKYLKTI